MGSKLYDVVVSFLAEMRRARFAVALGDKVKKIAAGLG